VLERFELKKIWQATILSTLIALSSCVTETPSSTGRQTLPEERTTLENTETTVAEDLGPLPTPDWEDEELILREIVQAEEPTVITSRLGEDDLWIAERSGTVKLLARSLIKHRSSRRAPNAVGELIRVTETEYFQLANQTVLNISDQVSVGSEGGLLGIAFSTNGNKLYVSYTNLNSDTVIAEYDMQGNFARRSSERILLTVSQPQTNHNGGQITIGPDGFLYIALGDGGGGGDPDKNSQNTQTLLGSILRIDPGETEDGDYTIPVGNPFKDKPNQGLPEIWLYGVRNPWRFSFDSDTGDLWIGDVGQNTEEEITLLKRRTSFAGRGANLGWNLMEGNTSFEGGTPPDDHVGPIYSYQTDSRSCSVVGGYVYRGELLAYRINGNVDKPIEGLYLFADYCNQGIRALEVLPDGRVIARKLNLDRDPQNVISFGEVDKEIFVLEQSGTISRLEFPDTTRAVSLISPNSRLPESNIAKDSVVLPGDPESEATRVTE